MAFRKEYPFQEHYQDYSHSLNSIFGVGYAAYSYIAKKMHSVNDKKFLNFSKETKCCKAFKPTLTEQIGLSSLKQLELGRIDVNKHREIFNNNFEDIYRDELAFLLREQVLEKKRKVFLWKTKDAYDKMLYSSIFLTEGLLERLSITKRKANHLAEKPWKKVTDSAIDQELALKINGVDSGFKLSMTRSSGLRVEYIITNHDKPLHIKIENSAENYFLKCKSNQYLSYVGQIDLNSAQKAYLKLLSKVL